MTIRYDDVLEKVLAVVEGHAAFANLDEVVIVRDLRGGVRLALRGRESETERASLDSALEQALGPWHGGAPLSTADHKAKTLAQHIVDKAEDWPAQWPQTWVDPTGGSHDLTPEKWKHVQRVLAKEDWVRSDRAGPPWELHAKTPTVVAFYSFKGGVGRSTALGIVAWQLAKAQKRVLAIDLDLEAPGLGGLFGIPPVSARPGVLDWLVEHGVGQRPALQGAGTQPSMLCPVRVHGVSFDVIPAGDVDTRSYLEKLARLDYHQSVESKTSPVKEGLKELLQAVRRMSPAPDYILLDARAGFHDIGGLSLTTLAHVDVIVARQAAATEPGLRLTVEMLKQRRKLEDQLLVFGQAFAPPARASDPEPAERRAFSELVAKLLPPEAPRPVCLEENADIARAFTLHDIQPTTLAGASGYSELVQQIEMLATPPPSGTSP